MVRGWQQAAAGVLGGVAVWVLGVAMNNAALLANDGKMPVLNGRNDYIHVVEGSHSHLVFLADWISIQFSWLYNGQGAQASPGDMLLWSGECAIVLALIVWLVVRLRAIRLA